MYELFVARWNFFQAILIFCTYYFHLFFTYSVFIFLIFWPISPVVRLQVQLSTRWKVCKKVFSECKKLEDSAMGYVARFPNFLDIRRKILTFLELRCKTSELGLREKLKVDKTQTELENQKDCTFTGSGRDRGSSESGSGQDCRSDRSRIVFRVKGNFCSKDPDNVLQ